MANATRWAPQLLNTPHFEGQVVVFRSPHSRQVMLVDVAENLSGQLKCVAEMSEEVTKTAIDAHRMMGNKMEGEFERGFFSFTQCQNFCANHAIHHLKGQLAKQAIADAVDWVATTVSLPHELAVAKLLEANLLPPSHNMVMTQELIGRVVFEQQRPSALPSFLLDAYKGRIDSDNYDADLGKMIIDNPQLINIFRALPPGTVDTLREFALEGPVDDCNRYFQDRGFIRAGDNRLTVCASLDGFLKGTGLSTELVHASLYQEQGDEYEMLFSQRLLDPETLASLSDQYQVKTFEVAMTPEGYTPMLVSDASFDKPYVLTLDLIDGHHPTPETFERVVQRAGLECDPEIFVEIGTADHTAAPAMRMG